MKRTVTAEYAPTKRTKTNKRKQYVSTRISRGPLFDPTPNSVKVRMRYCKYVDLTSNLVPDNFQYTAFRANSVYDPDYTGVGRKACGMELYSDMYSKYRVLKSYIKVTPATNNMQGVYFVYKTPRNVIPETTTETLLEKKEAKFKAMRDETSSCVQYFNAKEDKSLDQENWTSLGGNPQQDWFYFVGTNSANSSAFIVEIMYDVELSDRKPLISG